MRLLAYLTEVWDAIVLWWAEAHGVDTSDWED